jgi:hypothetical protein
LGAEQTWLYLWDFENGWSVVIVIVDMLLPPDAGHLVSIFPAKLLPNSA